MREGSMKLLWLCVISVIALNGCATADLERALGERITMGTFQANKGPLEGDFLSIEGTQKWGGGGRSECELHLKYTNQGSAMKKPRVIVLVLQKQSGNTFGEETVLFPTIMPGKQAYERRTLYGGHCGSLTLKVAFKD